MDWSNLPPLASLRAFEAAARHLSHSAAARELGVTHAAIAQQVRALEAHLGQTLLTRAGRGLTLTAEGRMLSVAATAGFGQIAQCLADLDARAAARPLFLTMTPTFGLLWFMPRMHAFRAKHPEIELSISTSVKIHDVARDGMDAAIRIGGPDWPGLDVETLIETDFVVAGAPALIAKYQIGRPQDLLALPWIQDIGSNEIGHWMEIQQLDADPPANMSEMPGYMMLAALREGQGIGAAVRLFIEDDIADGRLVVLSDYADAPQRDDTKRGYQLLTSPGAQRPALKTFLRWLKREARAANPHGGGDVPATKEAV